MTSENAPVTVGRMTRSMAKQLEAGSTPSGPATQTKTSGPNAPMATPHQLFKDVTNSAAKPMSTRKTPAKSAAKPAAPPAQKEEEPQPDQKQQQPAAGGDSDNTAASTETVRGSSDEASMAGCGAEEQGAAPAPPAVPAQPACEEDGMQAEQQQQQAVQEPASPAVAVATPEQRAPLPKHEAHTASKAVQGNAAAPVSTPLTTVKATAATPALMKPEVHATPAAPQADTPATSAPAPRTMEKQVSISTPKEPKSATLARPVVRTPFPKADPETIEREEAEDAAEEAALEAADTAAADSEAAAPQSESKAMTGSELYGEMRDEQGQPIGAVEYAGSEFNRGLEGSENSSPVPLTMSPMSPAVWSMPGSEVEPSPSFQSMAGTTPAGGSTAVPSPAVLTMNAGATPAAGKSTAAPSPAPWSLAGNTPAAGSTAAPTPAWSMGTAATPYSSTPYETMEQDASPNVPGSQMSARTCAAGGQAPSFGGFESAVGEEESEDATEEQVPQGALSSLVSAEEMLGRAQARMAAMCTHTEAPAPEAAPEGTAAPAPTPEAAAAKPRLKSRVVATEAYDPRSLAQIKRELKAAHLKKKAEATSDKEAQAQAAQVQNLTDVRHTPLVSKSAREETEEEEEEGYTEEADTWQEGDQDVDEQLTSAMGGLGIRPPGAKPESLRGLPLPQGTHMRFDDETGVPMDSPTSGKPALRGLPQATGQHIRFD